MGSCHLGCHPGCHLGYRLRSCHLGYRLRSCHLGCHLGYRLGSCHLRRRDLSGDLMRRHVIIFRQFGVSTGHEHPHMQAALINYRALLKDMGLSQQQIVERLEEMDLIP